MIRRATSRSDLRIPNETNTLSFPSTRARNARGPHPPAWRCSRILFKAVPLGTTSWPLPVHGGFPCSLYRTGRVHPLLNRPPFRSFHNKFPRLLALFNFLQPIPMNQSIALRHTPQTSCSPNAIACGLNRTDQTARSKTSTESIRPQVQLLPIDELENSHAVMRLE